MPRPVYQDEFVTEYDDGSTEVRFTDAEWEVMLADPAFGYVCRNGHRLRDADHRYGSCLTCEGEAEAAIADEEAAYYGGGEAAVQFVAAFAGHRSPYFREPGPEIIFISVKEPF